MASFWHFFESKACTTVNTFSFSTRSKLAHVLDSDVYCTLGATSKLRYLQLFWKFPKYWMNWTLKYLKTLAVWQCEFQTDLFIDCIHQRLQLHFICQASRDNSMEICDNNRNQCVFTSTSVIPCSSVHLTMTVEYGCLWACATAFCDCIIPANAFAGFKFNFS